MNNLRNNFERFCYNNRHKGIPNLMLYVVLGNAIVLIMSLFNGGSVLYEALYFDKAKILQGQVWRLITFIFTQSGSGILELLFLYFFYMLGRHVELSMGTFKFNLYYLTGIVLMDIFAMIFSTDTTWPLFLGMSYYLHLSLILTFATTHPDAQFMIFFIIPVKAWVIALIDLFLVIVEIFNLSYPVMYFPHNLFPLVAMGNYLLFVGKDIVNLIPYSWRAKRAHKAPQKKAPQTGTIPLHKTAKAPDFRHKCTICGRTDVTNPELEFRYCSRCNGYFCYCQDHISNHTHID